MAYFPLQAPLKKPLKITLSYISKYTHTDVQMYRQQFAQYGMVMMFCSKVNFCNYHTFCHLQPNRHFLATAQKVSYNLDSARPWLFLVSDLSATPRKA